MLFKTFLRHPLRVIGRALWLCGGFTVLALDYFWNVATRRNESLRTARARWLQRSSLRLLRVANVTWQTNGPAPKHGLLISNHLSYLDVLVLAANSPCAFVAKREVKFWPVLGWFAQIAGTVFVDREKRSDVTRITNEIKQLLDDGTLVVLFPEGTSSGGNTVLPFKSALLEPATKAGLTLTVGSIGYTLTDGSVPDEVCYWGEMTLLPHLLNVLGKSGVKASLAFAPVEHPSPDRKILARQLYAEVLRLKNALIV